MEGTIFSIEEFSTFDGPGIRTTVFLKGCPLFCEWCHSPEGRRVENSVLKSPNGCLHCGNCLRYAEIKDGKPVFTQDSIDHCPNDLLRWSGTVITAKELTDRLCRNADLLNESGGGVTFSGGEPLAQAPFLLECLTLLRGKTHRAVQTCGYAGETDFRRVLKEADYVLFDLKLLDEKDHIRYTRRSNKPILRNLELLVRSGVEFVIRVPLIPTVCDTEKNITSLCECLRSHGIDRVELLPYNKMAGSKYAAAGETYAPSFDESIPSDCRGEIFDRYGIRYQLI